MNIVDNRKILVKDNYDIVVVGGGIAGISASVAAAREGSKVLLIEKSIILGGLATIGLISWYEPLCDGAGTKMIGGIAEELIQLAIKYGYDNLPDEWCDGVQRETTEVRYASHYSPTMFAMAIDRYLEENNVKIRLDSLATFPVMKNGICNGVVVESKEGREFFGAKVIIDTTGDAEISHRAGIPTVNGENFLTYVSHGTNYKAVENYVKSKDMLELRKWFTVGSNLRGKGHP